MSKILTFFLNALKAIFLSPFYLIYFILYLLYTLFAHLFGEICVLFSGFKFGNKKYNKYEQELNKLKQKGAR